MALRWTDMKAQNSAAELKTLLDANNQLTKSFNNIGSSIDKYTTNRTKNETDAFLAELMGQENQEVRDTMIAAQDQDFLNMARIADKNYELGASDRAFKSAKEIADYENVIADEDATTLYKRNKELDQIKINADKNTAADLAQYNLDVKDQDNIANLALKEALYASEADKRTFEEKVRQREVFEAADLARTKYEQSKITGIEAISTSYTEITGEQFPQEAYTGYQSIKATLKNKHGITNKNFDNWAVNDFIFDPTGGDSFAFLDNGVLRQVKLSSFGLSGKDSSDVAEDNAKLMLAIASQIRFSESNTKAKSTMWNTWNTDSTKSEGLDNQSKTNFTEFEAFYTLYSQQADRKKRHNQSDFWTYMKQYLEDETLYDQALGSQLLIGQGSSYPISRSNLEDFTNQDD